MILDFSIAEGLSPKRRRRVLANTKPMRADLDRIGAIQSPRPPRIGPEPSLAEIMWAVSTVTGVPVTWMKSPRRSDFIVHARRVFFWIARRDTHHSFPTIGRTCGDRDHSTVCYAVSVVRDNFEAFEAEIAAATAKLLEAAP